MIEWKDIPGYEGLYQIGSHGEIKSLYHGKERILKGGFFKGGYRCATLCINSINKQNKHHRLVATAFIPNPNNFPVVMHLDNNRTNNDMNNLKWGSHLENVRQCINEGRFPQNLKWKTKGDHRLAKIVYQYSLDNKYIKKHDSFIGASDNINIHPSGISGCCRGKQKTAGGYKWSYNLIAQ